MSIPCLLLWELATTHGPCWSVDQVPTFHVGTMWPSLSRDTADCILNRLLTRSEPVVFSLLGILGLDIENLVKGCWAWDLRSQVRAIKRRAIEATSYLIHDKADKTCLHREKNEADVLTKVWVGVCVAERDGQNSLGFSFSNSWDKTFLFVPGFYKFSLIPFFSLRGFLFLTTKISLTKMI